jgi:hypothetical protein
MTTREGAILRGISPRLAQDIHSSENGSSWAWVLETLLTSEEEFLGE